MARPTVRNCSRRRSRRCRTYRQIVSQVRFSITDGRVHDIPANAAGVGFNAPVHALVTGRSDERDRRIAIVAAPRFGIVGQTQTITYRLDDQGVTGESARVTVRRDGDVLSSARVRSGEQVNVTIEIPHAGQNIVEIEAPPLRQRTDASEQPRRGVDRRRARQAARAAGVRRTAFRRTHLAQPAEIRCQRRSGALHHSAPAGEAGRHADQRTVADRISDPRVVPAEDQRISVDHLRPLCTARRAADFRISTTSRATSATAALCWSRPVPIMRDRPASGARRSTRCFPPSPRGDSDEGIHGAPERNRKASSGDARARGREQRSAALEPLLPPRRYRAIRSTPR